jgi:hypothetical protein
MVLNGLPFILLQWLSPSAVNENYALHELQFFFMRACYLLILEANVDTMGKTDNLKHTICA